MYRQSRIKMSVAGLVFGLTIAGGVGVITHHVQAQVPPASPQPSSSLQQRIEQRKTERGIVLDAVEEKRLPSVCTTAQSKLRPIQQTATTAADARIKINDTVDARLWIMIGKVKLAGLDAYDLETVQSELRTKMAASEQTTAEYRQAIDDLTAIDCRADIVGFKALLETARIYHTQLRDQLRGQRDYINDEVKAALNDYATELQGRSNNREGTTDESQE